jgi:MFS family permease
MFSNTIWRSVLQYNVNWVVKILIISDLIIWSAGQLFTPVFALFIEDHLSNDPIQVVGTAVAIYLITRSICEIPVGIFVDRTHSEKDDLVTAVIGTVIMAIAYFLYTTIGEVWQLYLLQVLLGFGTAVAFPGWYSMFTRHIDKTKEAFSWSLYDVSLGAGMAVAAALGSIIASQFGFQILFYIASAMTLLGAITLCTVKGQIFRSHHHHSPKVL